MSRTSLFAFMLVAVTAFATSRDGMVGINVGEDFTAIIGVEPHSPAARAGVRVGDRIVAVDEHPIAALEKVGFRRRVSGQPGSEIKLELQRAGRKRPLRFRLRRVPVPTPIPPGFDSHQGGR